MAGIFADYLLVVLRGVYKKNSHTLLSPIGHKPSMAIILILINNYAITAGSNA